MQGNPLDMFDEMDEMFAHLISRMDLEFRDSTPLGYGYRFISTDNGESLEMADAVDPQARLTKEPVAEVHRIGREVKVIADLPGLTEEALRLDVKGNMLVIDAGDADHHYHISAVLPPVDTASMIKTLKNGVLEVTFICLSAPSEKA